MSSFLLWAQQQEISTSHTSESSMQEDSPSKYVPLRDFGGGGGGLDCLFVEVVLICTSILRSILMNNNHLIKVHEDTVGILYVAQRFIN